MSEDDNNNSVCITYNTKGGIHSLQGINIKSKDKLKRCIKENNNTSNNSPNNKNNKFNNNDSYQNQSYLQLKRALEISEEEDKEDSMIVNNVEVLKAKRKSTYNNSEILNKHSKKEKTNNNITRTVDIKKFFKTEAKVNYNAEAKSSNDNIYQSSEDSDVDYE